MFAKRELATLGMKQFCAKMFPFTEIPFSIWTPIDSTPPRRMDSDPSLEPGGHRLTASPGSRWPTRWPLQKGSRLSVCETAGDLFEGCLLLPHLSPARTGITYVFTQNPEPRVPRGAQPRGSLRALVINSKVCHQLYNPENALGAGPLLAVRKLQE